MDPATARPAPEDHVVAGVEPLDVTGVRTVTVGTLLFLLGFLALLPFRSSLAEAGRTWWLLTCVAGFALGLFGIWYCRRRARLTSQ